MNNNKCEEKSSNGKIIKNADGKRDFSSFFIFFILYNNNKVVEQWYEMEQSGGNIQMVMFTGEYRHNLDPKKQTDYPSKYRDQLTTNDLRY